ncbi:uracil phosphoribosyltransferase [Streptosporangium sp. NBC_01639]|uniref:uracil phosphoribosyltransferase n=1 Tax=Streptosporangium sp. NBC_01639 TaxID=2975948 RepID=UPI00386C3606
MRVACRRNTRVATPPEGIAAVDNRCLELRMTTSAIEERLNVNAYMSPGIGGFGDRCSGMESGAA